MYQQTYNLLNELEKENLSFTITDFMGRPRSGKTLSMVSIGERTYSNIKTYCIAIDTAKRKGIPIDRIRLERYNLYKKYKVISNLDLDTDIFGDYERLTVNRLMEMYENKEKIQYSIILLDDIFKTIDSRKFMKKVNMAMSYFITEIGKSENILYYVSHFSNMIDYRLRKFTEYFVYCQKGEIITLLNGKQKIRVFKEYDNYYKRQPIEKLKRMVIKQTWFRDKLDMDNFDLRNVREIDKIMYIPAYPIFSLYNTKEII